VEKDPAPVHSSGPQPVAAADLRGVPLAQLPGDLDALEMVRSVIRILEDSRRIRVARFNSAI
jgi:hypothetical protein